MAGTASAIYEQLAAAIGEIAAQAMLRRFGGRDLYIRKRNGRDDAIVAAIGVEATKLLRRHFGGELIYIPRRAFGPDPRSVRRLAATQGLTRSKIAEQTGYSERQVYRILADGDASAQPDLFG